MWEIYAYHNSQALFGVFNAIAAIMGSGTYLGAVAAVAFCGFVAAMVAYMFQPEKLQGWKWLGTVVLIYGVLFVPRVTVQIVDKTGGTPNLPVANVPFGIAALGGLTSTIGNSITEVFETAFQVLPGPAALPPELSYQRNGLMFGSRMIQELRRTSLPDPDLRTDLINFVGNCTVFDIADGTIPSNAFSRSGDLWPAMAFTNPARFSTVTTPAGITTNTCDAVYASIDARMPAQIANISERLAGRMNPSMPTLAAQAALAAQVPQAFIRSQIAASSVTASDLIRQNALINAVNDAAERGCQKINDPSCMMMATGRAAAVASQNAAWINGAKISEQALPVVRNVAEAMCYAIFPLFVLLLFLSSGRTTMMMISGYSVALVSIQLWPPLFAILNYMASLYAQIDQAAAAELGGGVKALSLQTASPIYSNAVSAQAVVSYLIIGIPMLAYSLANRMANFGSAVMGGLQGVSSTSMSGSATAAASVGNSNLGNVTMDQRMVSPTTSNAFSSRTEDFNGNWVTTAGSGAQATAYLQNQGASSRTVSFKVASGASIQASAAADAARTDAVSASNDLSATLVDTMSRGSSAFRSSGRSDSQSVSSSSELSSSADRVRAISDSVSATTGLDARQVANIAFQLSGGVGAPGISPLKAGASGSLGKSYSGTLSEAEQKVANQLTSEQLREFKSFAERATSDQSFVRSLGKDEREGNELASRLSNAVSRSESAQSTYSQRATYAQQVSSSSEGTETIAIDLAKLPANGEFMQRYNALAEQYGPDSQALQAAMSSEIASRGLPVNSISGGAALPTSFGAVQSMSAQNSSDPRFSKNAVGAADASNDRSAAPRIDTRGLVPPQPSQGLKGVRSDVTDQVNSAMGQPTASATFDERNEIVRSPDGTVSTRQSLLLGNASQIRDDVVAMGKNAQETLTDAVTSLPAQRAKELASDIADYASDVKGALTCGPGPALKQAEEGRLASQSSERVQAAQSTPEVPTMTPRSGKRK